MSVQTPLGSSTDDPLAKPLHVQRIEGALRLDTFLSYTERILKDAQQSDADTTTDGDTDIDIEKESVTDVEGNKVYCGLTVTKTERKADKSRLYNFSKVKKSRRWLKNILLSDSSSDEDDDSSDVTQEVLHDMLKLHKYQKRCQLHFYRDPDMQQYQYYSVGLLSNYDKFYEHQKMVVGPKKKLSKEQRKLEKKLMKAKLKKFKEKGKLEEFGGDNAQGEGVDSTGRGLRHLTGKSGKVKKLTPEQIAAKRRKIWTMIAKKEIPKSQKQKASARKEILTSLKKVAKECQKECRRTALQSQKAAKEAAVRARRLSKEVMVYWKRFEKVEKEHRKRAAKEAHEQRKMDLELREMKRQQRKLNFLITQTELYAHFMSKKITGDSDVTRDQILSHLNEDVPQKLLNVDGGTLTDIATDDYDGDRVKEEVLHNAEEAYKAHHRQNQAYDMEVAKSKAVMGLVPEGAAALSLANPVISAEAHKPQPLIFQGKLKEYQLKGMNWLANLYDQGINGILADEMGLGKTVQSIALLGYLAESHGIWGPFVIVAPASTLHNWQQEVARFMPKFKVVPYWGNTQDRKVLRKFWNPELIHTEDASFHVVVTSYQLIIQDVKYFQRIRWHYMILDEAQAIKSTSSARWKILLGFNCRNRLLLTGTPIQNTMAELWALLHFIMPTLFDSHDEFNEWFSKDIENFAEKQSGLDEDQLSRLHMILKPFMLRRVKKDVENELSDKIQILIYCPLTIRQRMLYQAVKNKISIEDLLQSSTPSNNSSQAQTSTSSLMNLVMQFRKVCNHPELFERREIRSPFFMHLEAFQLPKLIFRDGLLDSSLCSKRHLVFNRFYVHNEVHVHRSFFPQSCVDMSASINSEFSFTRFINCSPGELTSSMLGGLLIRWLAVFLWLKEAYRINHESTWHSDDTAKSQFMGRRSLLLTPLRTTSVPNLATSPRLSSLIFLRYDSAFYTHCDHTLHHISETQAHRNMRLRNAAKDAGKAATMHHVRSPSYSGLKSPPHATTGLRSPSHSGLRSPPHSGLRSPPHSLAGGRTPLSPVSLSRYCHKKASDGSLPHIERPPVQLKCTATCMPGFVYDTVQKVHARSSGYYCCDRSAAWCQMSEQLCGTLAARLSLLYGTLEIAEKVRQSRYFFRPMQPGGIYGLHPRNGYSHLLVPDKETLVTDGGKLTILDELLGRLKSEGHRVLIYSQMTRMIDILEEYMWHRKHTYMRLDGSSKLSDRRDMVADFQTRTDIFVFLLSTRAGGLGINLTAADTVIFYDSDWNPTVDQQAMDRAHRLGQTKQVTVYRLICKGTIEERILQRAKEKSEIQRMVISGGNFRPDVLKPKEVVSLLLDDDDMERKLRHKQKERHYKEETYKEKDRERKRKQYQYKKTGRGPGRPKKKKLDMEDEQNQTIIAAPDLDSNISMDSTSIPASPQSNISFGSEATSQSLTMAEDSSNDGLVIVDDAHSNFPPILSSTPPPVSHKRGRPRGRPRGAGTGRRPRGRGSVQKALIAAEVAAQNAGKAAAYAAYGYNFTGKSSNSSMSSAGSVTASGTERGLGAGNSAPVTPINSSTPTTTPRASPRSFYSPRTTPNS